MRQEATYWMQDAQNDLADSRKMAAGGMFNWAVLAARQCVEKALKASYIVLKREDPPWMHSLTGLAQEVFSDVPVDRAEDLRDLNRHYTTTRYPDAVAGVTADAYSSVSAQEAIEQAERCLRWITEALNSPS